MKCTMICNVIIKGCLSPEQYIKVQGRDDAKEVWEILKMAHEGDAKARGQRIESLDNELGRFSMIKGELVQSLYDRLMVIVNKIRGLGSNDWSDFRVTKVFLRAYMEKDLALARMIRDRDDYETMTPHWLLAKIQQHESDESPLKETSKDPHALVANN